MLPVVQGQTIYRKGMKDRFWQSFCAYGSIRKWEKVVSWNTYEEVEDGHVYDVEEPVARVIGIQLLYGVTEEGIHFPPLKTDVNV